MSMKKVLIGVCAAVILLMPLVALSAGNYTDNGNGTVTDNDTGLMWMKGPAPSTMVWMNALNYCESSELLGHSDWRLPNIKELQTLVDHSRINPAIDTDYFIASTNDHYWSSTTYAKTPSYAWYLRISAGYVSEYGKTNASHEVRCVR